MMLNNIREYPQKEKSDNMQEIKGKCVSQGIAFGKILFYSNNISNVQKYTVDDTDAELQRYKKALEPAVSRLKSLYYDTRKNIGENESVIFQTHIMILEDAQFIKNVEDVIVKNKLNAEYAVYATALKIAEMFKKINDEYLQQRYFDILDSANTLLEILEPETRNFHDTEKLIIAAAQLLPSDIVRFKEFDCLGFITNTGAENSHAAILARSTKLPAVININEDLSRFDGLSAIIDGHNNKIIIQPDDDTLALYKIK